MPKIETVAGVLYLNPGNAGLGVSSCRSPLLRWTSRPAGMRPIIHDLEAKQDSCRRDVVLEQSWPSCRGGLIQVRGRQVIFPIGELTVATTIGNVVSFALHI